MSTILAISKREITRLKSRFTGRSRFMVMGIMLFALIVSYVIYHQNPGLSKDLYNVGVSPDGPAITDQRFSVFTLEHSAAYDMLSEGTLDAYVQPDRVSYNGSERSQYALGALMQYLEKQELLRISGEYEIGRAFPLRIEVHHLERDTQDESDSKAQVSLVDILGQSKDAKGQPVTAYARPEAGPPVTSRPNPPSTSKPEATDIPNSSRSASLSEPPDMGFPSSPPPVSTSATDTAVRQRLVEFENNNGLPKFKAEFVSDKEIIVPSLLDPPIPLSQVLLTFLYVVPIFFVSVFFTSSFIEEKTNRKLVILLSAPVTPLQIILGKMLPYIGYSVIAIIAITLVLQGNILLALAIFIPVMLFILSIYLMVALLYRTFKDQTFFSVLAVWVITAYLVAPAMFSGVGDLSYISPLTLAVEMYRGESFGLSQYFLSTIPMYLIFMAAMFVGTRTFNEEYLMGFRPLHKKLGEAAYLIINRNHLSLSVLFLSIFFIPAVFMVQSGSIVLASNLPMPFSMGILLALAIVIEEVAKSVGIVVLLQNRVIKSPRSIIRFSFLSALGFRIGEKLLLFLAMSVMSETMFVEAIFSTGLLVLPLILHFVATSVVCLTTARFGTKCYPFAILAGSAIHSIYNLSVIGWLS